MVSLQPRLNLKVAQKQILTPGLVQMVSVLALNKLELRDMIQAEMVENPVLEELEDSVPILDDVERRDEAPVTTTEDAAATEEKKDSFDEIDLDSYFQNYLDPGYRSPDVESIERPSFENFLSKPATLTDHLLWQLGAMIVRPEVRIAAELVIGNLDEDGYLTASEDELMAVCGSQLSVETAKPSPAENPAVHATGVDIPVVRHELQPEPALPEGPAFAQETLAADHPPVATPSDSDGAVGTLGRDDLEHDLATTTGALRIPDSAAGFPVNDNESVAEPPSHREAFENALPPNPAGISLVPHVLRRTTWFTLEDLREAVDLVRQMDPAGVAARDLRECLLAQLKYHENLHQHHKQKHGENGIADEVLTDAVIVVSEHLKLVQNKQTKEIAKAMVRPLEAVQAALDFLKTLDPRPGQRYNQTEPRLIEPDVAIIKQRWVDETGHSYEYRAILNDEDVPQLRLSHTYRKLLKPDPATEKDVRNYVKDKYKSAIQLIKNIEQRKQTILKVCYSIIDRQSEFLEKGIDYLLPMMIKEVAEEIGVHPSTVSRAVANKYAHTPQGVFELRFFFSESVQGPEGNNTSLLILKRRVKKLIEEEDPARPYTDEQVTRILQSQGIQVTRRTVAKYREDMRIPSTHQRRVKN
ncbi:MAG: RNA polymerase factor sigma-54 [Terriglobales bacterium]|jgi:RNA polymerase sigma-54 factor